VIGSGAETCGVEAAEPRNAPYRVPAARRLRAHPARHGTRSGDCERWNLKIRRRIPLQKARQDTYPIAGGRLPASSDEHHELRMIFPNPYGRQPTYDRIPAKPGHSERQYAGPDALDSPTPGEQLVTDSKLWTIRMAES
jgi:hypothetical protein